MSKCGYCGFEGDIGEHMVLRCKTEFKPEEMEVVRDALVEYIHLPEDGMDVFEFPRNRVIAENILGRLDGRLDD